MVLRFISLLTFKYIMINIKVHVKRLRKHSVSITLTKGLGREGGGGAAEQD